MKSFTSLVALGALLAVAGSVHAQTATPTATTSATAPISSPLKTAKTIQVKGTFSIMGRDKKMTPFFSVDLTVAGQSQYRIDALPLFKQGDKTLPTSFYFNDGKKQYEYNSLQGQYRIADAPKPGERPMSQLASMASLSLVLTPGVSPARAGVQRTTGEEVVNGRKMVVTTDVDPPRKSTEGKSYSSFTRIWIDAETGLPFRQLDGILADGVYAGNNQFEFSDWTFDKPVPAPTFVWTVPPGATPEAEPKLLAVGAPAPDFAAVTADGKTVHLSDLKGQIVVLDFWATWCGPCQASMPHLESVYKQVKDKGVAVLALCVWDERAAYDKWIVAKKGTYSFPTAFDPAGRGAESIASKLFLVKGIPTQYVIDKNGKVAAAFVGYEAGKHPLEDTLKAMHIDLPAPTEEKAAAATGSK